ncbi:alpha/beta hydrolase [Dellaglioa carnosa]|uniref:Alpha/beta hydrolase n=1 Tax=Dellaglioa carnosa TaxID=2995136 RepID=A0ABT4JM12_9LACO|nr:alpha/beta hydrolase [Dellaglioa carnosa]MCZ2491378.1 alpha/beta hydrolase [Dellaglioa carnosa]MCZ2494456.1 alpha/beta hydrolase [Dellaglioa carnosa]MDK1731128.1 alpha/beta hydrolase [Dellaglioa carnosa]
MKKYGILITILLILGLGTGFFFLNKTPSKNVVTVSTKDTNQVPTLYVHGYGGSANSTNAMIAAAEKSDKAQKVLTAIVSSTGDVTYSGDWQESVKNPIIQVVFKRSNAQIPEEGEWIGEIVTHLQKSYKIKAVNIVAHSMGGSSAVYWAESVRKESDPKLNNFVPIAVPINGVLGMNEEANKNVLLKNGEPKSKSENYQSYYENRKKFPSNTNVFVIYGDIDDGSNSDTAVSIVSARSMSYLLKDQVKSYKELKITGENAQHSKLHSNDKVDQAVIQFLWGK